MTEATVPSKLELLEALRSSRDHVLATVSRQSPQALEEGRYENGWNGRQILAHVASIEWTYPSADRNGARGALRTRGRGADA